MHNILHTYTNTSITYKHNTYINYIQVFIAYIHTSITYDINAYIHTCTYYLQSYMHACIHIYTDAHICINICILYKHVYKTIVL